MTRTVRSRRIYYPLIGFCMLVICSGLSCKPKGSHFDWITGTWLTDQHGMLIGESWSKLDANHYHAKAFAISGKDSSVYEHVSLEKKDGDWYYTVTATRQNDNKPVPFRLTSSESNSFVFENPEHDFPKRIIYRYIHPDSLHASIDAGGSPPKQEVHFYFGRVKK